MSTMKLFNNFAISGLMSFKQFYCNLREVSSLTEENLTRKWKCFNWLDFLTKYSNLWLVNLTLYQPNVSCNFLHGTLTSIAATKAIVIKLWLDIIIKKLPQYNVSGKSNWENEWLLLSFISVFTGLL